MMNLRLFATLFVALFAALFGVQFVYLANGDVINNYPFISPDGFDWYTQGIYVTQLLGGDSLPELPVLRPPFFVFITAVDFIFGNKGLVLAIAYGIATFYTYFFSLKLVDLVYEGGDKNSWYVVPLAISATIYPLNFFKPFLLADSLAVAMSLASVWLVIKHNTESKSHLLVLSGAVAILAGLTQTYALIPYLILCTISAFLHYRSDKKRTAQFIVSISLIVLIFILFTALWRSVLPHVTTPQNFDLLKFSTNMTGFYLSTWSYYFLPLILFFILFRSYHVAQSTMSIVVLLSVTLVLLFGALAYFYQWPDARFTFYLWPWLIILFFGIIRLNTNKASYLIAILMLIVVVLVPANYWEPSWKSIRVSISHNWVGGYFTASPTDRKLNDCKGGDCAGKNEFLNNSDVYVNSTINVYNQLRKSHVIDSNIAKKEAAKLGIAQKYENKIVHQTPANRPGIEDGAYLVKNGKRFWIANSAWMAKNGYAADAEIEISSSDFYAIPLDPKVLE